MADLVSIGLGVTQIAIQLVAVYLAYRLTQITGSFRAWSLIILALVLMTVRRITALMIAVNMMPTESGLLAYTDQILLPFAISVLLSIAMYEIVRIFRRQSKNP